MRSAFLRELKAVKAKAPETTVADYNEAAAARALVEEVGANRASGRREGEREDGASSDGSHGSLPWARRGAA